MANHSSEEIRSKALALSQRERARLARDLYLSLAEADEASLTPQQWEAELTRRLDAVLAGTTETHAAEDVHAEVEARLGRRPTP